MGVGEGFGHGQLTIDFNRLLANCFTVLQRVMRAIRCAM